jgi:hypothetical protein
VAEAARLCRFDHSPPGEIRLRGPGGCRTIRGGMVRIGLKAKGNEPLCQAKVLGSRARTGGRR